MPSDSRSVSFTFHRDFLNPNNIEPTKGRKSLRRRLQDRFEDHDKSSSSSLGKDKGLKKKDCSDSGKSWHNLSIGNVTNDSRKALQTGAERISKTLSNVKVTFGSISQVCLNLQILVYLPIYYELNYFFRKCFSIKLLFSIFSIFLFQLSIRFQ